MTAYQGSTAQGAMGPPPSVGSAAVGQAPAPKASSGGGGVSVELSPTKQLAHQAARRCHQPARYRNRWTQPGDQGLRRSLGHRCHHQYADAFTTTHPMHTPRLRPARHPRQPQPLRQPPPPAMDPTPHQHRTQRLHPTRTQTQSPRPHRRTTMRHRLRPTLTNRRPHRAPSRRRRTPRPSQPPRPLPRLPRHQDRSRESPQALTMNGAWPGRRNPTSATRRP